MEISISALEAFIVYLDTLYYQHFAEELYATNPVRYYYELEVFMAAYAL